MVRLAMSYLEKVQIDSNMDDAAVAQTLQTDREKAQGKYYRNFDFSELSNEVIKISSFGGHKVCESYFYV